MKYEEGCITGVLISGWERDGERCECLNGCTELYQTLFFQGGERKEGVLLKDFVAFNISAKTEESLV